jgi:cytoplasmic tRNA 2-thiolation protein 2
MISGIAQGAGFAMVSEGVEEVWKTKDQSIRIVRPLRDIGIKESAFWSYWSNLRIVGRERYPTAVSPVPNTGDESVKVASAMIKNQRLTSIDALTQDFIMGLEKDYPSTVSTIARTIAKVTTKEKGVEGGCVVCQR